MLEYMKLPSVSSQYLPRRSPESAHTLLLCEQLAARPRQAWLICLHEWDAARAWWLWLRNVS